MKIELRQPHPNPESTDSRMLWEWRNDPLTRSMSLTPDEVSWEDHKNWYAKTAQNPARKILIAIHEGKPVGMVRFDLTGADQALVSINMNPAKRGQGLGGTTLKTACLHALQNMGVKKLLAEIKPGNVASIRIFEGAGFRPAGLRDGVPQYVLERLAEAPIVFRVDASRTIGSGHVMRCLTLAEALREQLGKDSEFICGDHDGNLIDLITSKNFSVTALPKSKEQSEGLAHAHWLGSRIEDDLIRCQAFLASRSKKPEWLVVDHYALDARWETPMRKLVGKIFVIDDLADRPHDCDLLLDQNVIQANQIDYSKRIPKRCRLLLSPKYALLRKEFQNAPSPSRSGVVNRILIFFGGADATNQTVKALQAIALLEDPRLAVDVIIGPLNPHRAAIEKEAARLPNTTCHFNPPQMSEHMLAADLSIGAGGTTTWERCCLGLPSLVLALAPNQEPIAQALAQAGVQLYLGQADSVSAENLSEVLRQILADPAQLKDLAVKSRNLVDGKGIGRLLEEMRG